MRTALESPQTNRARLGDILTGQAQRSSDVQSAINAQIAAGGLTAIDAVAFGFFAAAASNDVCSITAGSNVLSSPDNPWTAADVGKWIDVAGAGIAGGTLSSVIVSYTNAGGIILRDFAGTTVAATTTSAGGLAVWGYPANQRVIATTLKDPAGNLVSCELVQPFANGPSRSESEKNLETVSVLDFGADRSGVSATDVQIQNAINYLAAKGGGVLRIPSGTYKIANTLVIQDHNLVVAGDGGNMPHDGGTFLFNGTKLQWSGGAAPVVRFLTPNSTTIARKTGMGMRDIWVDGNATANFGLSLTSINRSDFVRLHVSNVTDAAYYLTSYTSVGYAEAMDLQNCTFDRCSWRNIDTAPVQNGDGFYLTSNNPATDTANVSFNTFTDCRGQVYNGRGFTILNADNNSFNMCTVTVSVGTGFGILLKGASANCDVNYFYNFSCGGANMIRIQGTANGGVYNPVGNVFINTDEGNGTLFPQLDAGCDCQYHSALSGWQKLSVSRMVIADSPALAKSERANVTTETVRIRNSSNNHVVLCDATNAWSVSMNAATGDIQLVRTAGTGIVNVGNGTDVRLGGLRVTFGTAAPAAGTWARGDRCWNNQPAVGVPKSWTCTVPGTPGTWVSDGNL